MIIAGTEPQVRRWTVEEAGFFIDERVELINGEILRKPHSSAIGFLNNRLVRAFGETHLARVQLPLSVGSLSEPEPDFSLVRPELIEGYPRHPTSADLVVEVSDSSLSYDRGRKPSLYASAQVTEYWCSTFRNRDWKSIASHARTLTPSSAGPTSPTSS